MASFYPAATGDDGYITGGSTLYTNNLWFGPYPRTFIRFDNVTIPNGATITSAKVKLTSTTYAHGDLSGFDIHCEDADDGAQPASAADVTNKTLTTEHVAWTPGVWGSDEAQETPDITDVVKEVVDRVGWASGNHMVVIFEGGTNYGEVYGYENGSDYPELEVTWVEPYDNETSDSFVVDDTNASEYGAGSAVNTDSVDLDDSASQSLEVDKSITDTFTLNDAAFAENDVEVSVYFTVDDSASANEFYFEVVEDSFVMSDEAIDAPVYEELIEEVFLIGAFPTGAVEVACELETDLPMLEVAGYTGATLDEFLIAEGQPSWMWINAHTGATGDMELPSMSCEGYTGAYGDGELTALTCEGTAVQTYAFYSSTLPELTMNAHAFVEERGRLDQEFPALSATGNCGARADNNNLWAPSAIECSGTVLTGEIGGTEHDFPALEISAHAYAVVVGTLSDTLPGLRGTGTSITNAVGSLEKELPGIQLSGYAYSGYSASLEQELPSLTLSATGNQNAGLVALQEELPGLYLVATARGGDTGYYSVPVMNVRNASVTEWNLGFNSIASFNGKTFATDGTKIYEITGTTDSVNPPETEITCNIKTGNLDLANFKQMRFTDSYMNVLSDGDLLMQFELDEDDVFDFEVKMHNTTDTHEEKVNLGKGMKARVYAVSLYNVDGSSFTLNKLQLIGNVLD